MDRSTLEELQWIEEQKSTLIDRLRAWSEINSGSSNLSGLERMLEAIKKPLEKIADSIEEVKLPSSFSLNDDGQESEVHYGRALYAVKRPDAPIQVFLGGHIDTVFSPAHSFQHTTLDRQKGRLIGPGVADMKGGLLVMLTALEAFERSPLAKYIGWEVVINPDEEIGSCGSAHLLRECADRVDYALVFEPSFPDGYFVDSRKGSLSFAIIARGRKAHAGRDFEKGLNAITYLAQYIVEAEKINDPKRGISVNFGRIGGGGPLNVVPDLALCFINARAIDPNDFSQLPQRFLEITKQTKSPTPLEMHLINSRAPYLLDQSRKKLFSMLEECGKEEGIDILHRSSGGTCDGSFFAEAGVPVIDSLGVIGGGLHTEEEYMETDSLIQRAKLTTRLLMKIAKTAA